MTEARHQPSVAFFDVDETLLATKTLLDFWDFWTASGAWPLPDRVPDLRALVAAGGDRDTLNREYYRRFAGVPVSTLASLARRWYDAHSRGPRAFVTTAVEALDAHRCRGDEVVLVSGSLRPLLEAVAEDFGAAGVRCAEQSVTDGGLLTGEVDRPMIGQAKADAVTAVVHERGARAEDCWAYGDHVSDLAMLRSVGHPVVVGGSPLLTAEARRAGWTVLAGHTGPRRTAVGGGRSVAASENSR
ncbi:HAD family hydrolase [Streptomyces sp. NPDC048179]|uniref:HAD family hydrolase n=1 Tax=Streptomyces sp. NPDC048179 TaxID=3365506 RepID=UPI003718195B